MVTGSLGFVGVNLVLGLLSELKCGTAISFDNMSDYYDRKLKEYRLSLIEKAAKISLASHVFVRGRYCGKRAGGS